MLRIKIQKIEGKKLDKLRKLHMNWNSHLEFLNRSQAIENSRQSFLLRTDILQKTVVGCPWFKRLPKKLTSIGLVFAFTISKFSVLEAVLKGLF